ncbi:MAG TPA: acetate--CoA ligase family protein, partial [Burkholderiaceae bacterium]|nr:acetate--CoA ligase family protein [Burkholderiaceae bacterium]
PVAVVTVFDEQNRRELDEIGCLAMDEPLRAVRALAALASIRESLDRAAASSGAAAAMAPDAMAAQRHAPPAAPTEPQALSLLATIGIPIVAHRVVTSAQEAGAAADAFGVPVAIKVVSAQILHKSDAGGVALSVVGARDAQVAFDRVVANARRAHPQAPIDGAMVAPMVRGGVECILGVTVDPVFGPIVMFGLGGVLVEVLEDVSFRRAPFDAAEAHRMIREIRAYRVLEGVRGAPPADIDALADALAKLSCFAAANADWIDSIDVNPYIVRARGEGAVAVDALISVRGPVPLETR